MDAEHAHLFYERDVTLIVERADLSPAAFSAYKLVELPMNPVSLHESGKRKRR